MNLFWFGFPWPSGDDGEKEKVDEGQTGKSTSDSTAVNSMLLWARFFSYGEIK